MIGDREFVCRGEREGERRGAERRRREAGYELLGALARDSARTCSRARPASVPFLRSPRGVRSTRERSTGIYGAGSAHGKALVRVNFEKLPHPNPEEISPFARESSRLSPTAPAGCLKILPLLCELTPVPCRFWHSRTAIRWVNAFSG